jgi:VWFA-related protein
MSRSCTIILVLLIGFVVPIQAQSGRQPGSRPISTATPQPKNKRGDDVVVIDSDLVVLDARVVSRQTGRFVGGLKKDDFEVYEDGKRQEITHFSEDTPPLSVVFLIDMSGPATHGVLKKISTNIEQVLQHLRPEDEAAIMLVAGDTPGKGQVFSDIWLLHSFTKDKALLARNHPTSMWEYRRPDVPPTFDNVPTKHQAIYEAALLLEKVPPGHRRVILPLTDDIPWWTRREVKSNIFSGAQNRTISKKDLSRRLFSTDTMLCALVTHDPEWTAQMKPLMKSLESHPITKMISFAKGYNHFEYADMAFYAEPTGGEVILATDENADTQLGKLIVNLYVRYSFGYVSTNRKRDRKFRKITLRVSDAAASREGGVTVATKAGYYLPAINNKDETDRKK